MARALAWYNEPDRAKAAWLRHLIEEGVIARGIVDERPIQAVQPDDLHGYAQCHFFAGVGVWSYGLRLAGWPDDRPVWTGSCPCGPFSRAGLQKGFEDPRHLWPAWFPLIQERRPDVIFGEQSDAADAWIDLVASDLEDQGYAVGSPDLPAAGFAGAHKRQRFFWMADAHNAEWWSDRAPWNDGHWPQTGRVQGDRDVEFGGLDGGVELADVRRYDNAEKPICAGRRSPVIPELPQRVGDAWRWGSQGRPFERREGGRFFQGVTTSANDADWLWCRDRVWRPVESGTCPLVDEAPARMGRLRGYGDALDAEVTRQFISAYLEASP